MFEASVQKDEFYFYDENGKVSVEERENYSVVHEAEADNGGKVRRHDKPTQKKDEDWLELQTYLEQKDRELLINAAGWNKMTLTEFLHEMHLDHSGALKKLGLD